MLKISHALPSPKGAVKLLREKYKKKPTKEAYTNSLPVALDEGGAFATPRPAPFRIGNPYG